MYMSKGRLAAALTAALLVVPAGLTAQGHAAHHGGADGSAAAPRAMMGAGMMGSMQSGPMMGGPRILLAQRERLDLTDDQVTRLEELQSRMDELRSSHRTEMLSVREELGSLRAADDLDLDRYESLLRRQADLRVEMQVQMARTRREALGVLTDEQRSELSAGAAAMGRMQPGAGMPGAGMHGATPGMGMGTGRMNMMGGGPGGGHMMQMMAAMHARMHGQMQGQDCPMAPTTSEPSDEG